MFEVSVKTKKGTQVSTMRFTDDRCSVGKARENSITLHGWKVAKRHAEFLKRVDGVYVATVDPDADVHVNGQPTSQYGPVQVSDVIQIGDYHLSVTSLDAAAGRQKICGRLTRKRLRAQFATRQFQLSQLWAMKLISRLLIL